MCAYYSSPRASQVDEKPVQASGSRRNSDVQAPDQSGRSVLAVVEMIFESSILVDKNQRWLAEERVTSYRNQRGEYFCPATDQRFSLCSVLVNQDNRT